MPKKVKVNLSLVFFGLNVQMPRRACITLQRKSSSMVIHAATHARMPQVHAMTAAAWLGAKVRMEGPGLAFGSGGGEERVASVGCGVGVWVGVGGRGRGWGWGSGWGRGWGSGWGSGWGRGTGWATCQGRG